MHDLYFWAEGIGLEWTAIRHQEGNSVPRWTRPDKEGLELMTRLLHAYRERRGQIVFNAKITDIRLDRAGIVGGIEGVDSGTGESVHVNSKAVIMTTGGFASNADTVRQVRPELAETRVLEGSALGSTGDGHGMVRRVGGHLTHMDAIWFYPRATPDYLDPNERRGLLFWAPGYIWVNQQGRRFHDETRTGGASGSALMAQTPRHAWAVVDRTMAEELTVNESYYYDGAQAMRDRVEKLLRVSRFVRRADSLDGLAKAMEIPAAALRDTVQRYNSALDDELECDPEFGKPLRECKKLDAPPFYAIQFFPLARKNFGGVKTDLRCRVLDRHFEPIRGLYAAGEVCGMAGGHINGVAGLEGTMLGPSIFSGRVAGAWAAHEAGHGAGFWGRPNKE